MRIWNKNTLRYELSIGFQNAVKEQLDNCHLFFHRDETQFLPNSKQVVLLINFVKKSKLIDFLELSDLSLRNYANFAFVFLHLLCQQLVQNFVCCKPRTINGSQGIDEELY